MIIVKFILVGFMGWIMSVVFLDYYESERPQDRIETSGLDNHKKGIQRAKYRLSFIVGVFSALAWLVLYHWMNISN